MRKYYIFCALLVLFSIGIVATNGVLAQGPKHDRQVEADLSSIKAAIMTYAQSNHRLPSEIGNLKLSEDIKRRASSNGYEYEKISRRSYQLCAHFKTERKPTTNYASSDYLDYFNHPKGKHCYTSKGKELVYDLDEQACSRKNYLARMQVSVDAVDVKNRTIQFVGSLPQGKKLYWSSEPKVYDLECNSIPLAQLKRGAVVTIFYDQATYEAVELRPLEES